MGLDARRRGSSHLLNRDLIDLVQNVDHGDVLTVALDGLRMGTGCRHGHPMAHGIASINRDPIVTR